MLLSCNSPFWRVSIEKLMRWQNIKETPEYRKEQEGTPQKEKRKIFPKSYNKKQEQEEVIQKTTKMA